MLNAGLDRICFLSSMSLFQGDSAVYPVPLGKHCQIYIMIYFLRIIYPRYGSDLIGGNEKSDLIY